MSDSRVRLPLLIALSILGLLSTSALADAGKDESGHTDTFAQRADGRFGEGRLEAEDPDRPFRADSRRGEVKESRGDVIPRDRVLDDRRRSEAHRRGQVDWDVRGTWETRRGRIDVRVGDDRGDPYRAPYDCGHYDRGRYGCDGYGGRHGYAPIRVPRGHLPPPGACRVWIPGLEPGQQPPPTDCRSADIEARHSGGFVVYGGPPR